MHFFWRSETTPLPTHSGWVRHLEDKNRVQGTSAPTLATAWSGPLDLFAALAACPDLGGLTVHEATVEMKSTFDTSGGNVRNHDLVVRASTATGESVAIFVEAKAGEPLGATIAKQRMLAAKAKAKNANSKAEGRLDNLVARFGHADPRIEQVHYQLLTAWAGTLDGAAGSKHAVLAVHEFRTDARPEDKTTANGEALELFADVVLQCQLPSGRATPWCHRVPGMAGEDTALYLAHVATDLTTETLRTARG